MPEGSTLIMTLLHNQKDHTTNCLNLYLMGKNPVIWMKCTLQIVIESIYVYAYVYRLIELRRDVWAQNEYSLGATIHLCACNKPKQWTVMYLCARGIDFTSFYDLFILFWNCYDSVVLLLLFWILLSDTNMSDVFQENTNAENWYFLVINRWADATEFLNCMNL